MCFFFGVLACLCSRGKLYRRQSCIACEPAVVPLPQVIITKLSEREETKAAVLQFADEIMNTLLQVFAARSTTVHEEAMSTVGAFTYACGRQFTKYLPAFYPFLKMGLMNHQEWQVRSRVVGVGAHSGAK
jgi:importin subunit beta-1